MSLERFLTQAWYRGDGWLTLLRPLSWLFLGGVWLRRQAYAIGVLRAYRAPVPVIIVGNITVGGSGKTPTVIALVDALAHHGLRAGVVSRGYAGTANQQPHLVTTESLSTECGDEPLLIVQRTGCPCVVAESRPAAVQALLEHDRVDVIISDDGLQHYALARDLEIVLYDAQAGFGNGRCLPEGPLREPLARLAQADFVLARAGDNPSMAVAYRSDGLVNLHTEAQLPANTERLGAAVYAVAGLARPDLFFSMLAQQGFEVEPEIFNDHHTYRPADFAMLRDKPIIMTEKDAVKCRGILGANAWYLKISAVLPDTVIDAVVAVSRDAA